MKYHSFVYVALIASVGYFVGTAISQLVEPTPSLAEDQAPARKPEKRISLAAAKERAEWMHHIYAATLDAMHHHYFRANRAILPARAMEDVFADVARETQSQARWISVNLKAMSVDHEPATDFERQAASELSKGKPEFTAVEKGYYRRAGAIPLGASCIACHSGTFAPPSSTPTPKYAGLVISIPIDEESPGG